MFDSNQSIMLMGTAGNTDVSVHLANAHDVNSKSQVSFDENLVIISFIS